MVKVITLERVSQRILKQVASKADKVMDEEESEFESQFAMFNLDDV